MRRGVAAAVVGVVAAAALVVVLLATGGSDDGAPSAAPGPATAATGALVRRAQALVDVAPSDLGYRLVARGPRRDSVRGSTDTKLRTITLYVKTGDAAHRVAHDLAHEIGHAYDARRLTEPERVAWLRARGAPDARWFPGGPASDYDTGAGDFAEVFARCHAASPEFRSRLAPRPADACSLLPAGARVDRLRRVIRLPSRTGRSCLRAACSSPR